MVSMAMEERSGGRAERSSKPASQQPCSHDGTARDEHGVSGGGRAACVEMGWHGALGVECAVDDDDIGMTVIVVCTTGHRRSTHSNSGNWISNHGYRAEPESQEGARRKKRKKKLKKKREKQGKAKQSDATQRNGWCYRLHVLAAASNGAVQLHSQDWPRQ